MERKFINWLLNIFTWSINNLALNSHSYTFLLNLLISSRNLFTSTDYSVYVIAFDALFSSAISEQQQLFEKINK